MVDALTVRGYRVALETGTTARGALSRSVRGGGDRLRVVCLAEPVDPPTEARLCAALDPRGRGDLLLVPLQTPREVIEAVEGFLGAASRRSSVRRRSRPVLPHPTLVESPVEIGRWTGYGLAGGLVTAAVLGILHLGSTIDLDGRVHARAVRWAEPGLVAPPSPHHHSALVDDSVLSAAIPEAALELEPPPAPLPPRRSPSARSPEDRVTGPGSERDAGSRPDVAAPIEAPVASEIDAVAEAPIEPSTAPLEEIAPPEPEPVAAPQTPVEPEPAEGAPHSGGIVDPFAMP